MSCSPNPSGRMSCSDLNDGAGPTMRVRVRRGTAEEADTEPVSSANATMVEATSAPAATDAPDEQSEIIQKLDAGTRKMAQSMGIPFPALIAILIGLVRCRRPHRPFMTIRWDSIKPLSLGQLGRDRNYTAPVQ
ncbi:hypothetical protein FJT64_006669 [Amphibalanus amphitrite]|uniref:Uncharacterized protein n=1 Tax=Amphibalanus amphitrite TaxID=1232801 RepID=A0A6A4W1D0_AMPAM|nr:hypothetical protein FJT64_006669 [Amphibalanus amphitrite]